MTAEIGEVIGGYRLERLLGAGSTSQVFLGQHVVLGRKAAIKVLIPDLIGNEDVINRLLNEARVVNDIRHPNIIDIIDFINTESPRRVALVMEYVEGPSLSICRQYPLTFNQAIGVVLQLVHAVRTAHSAGVIHRDLKPDNLLLTTDPRSDPSGIPTLKIVDFGIAKIAHSNLAQTAVGTMLGTPAYMAPEQIAGRPRPSAATDVYAIGEVLYEVLSGRRAYPAATISETVRAKLRGEIPELKLPQLPGDKALLQVIRRCLAQRPEDRPGLHAIQSVLESLRPGSEAVQTEELEDVDAYWEVATRMVPGEKPQPQNRVPPAETELAEEDESFGSHTELSALEEEVEDEDEDPTPLGATPVATAGEEGHATKIERRSDPIPGAPTEASPLPPFGGIPKDTTSPTNRVLPALSDMGVRNAPTLPGALNRVQLEPAGIEVVRDEQSVSIGEIRIAETIPDDDEASVEISDFERSLIHEVPLGNDELSEVSMDAVESPVQDDDAIDTVDPDEAKREPVPAPPLRKEGGLDVPDTRITEVRSRAGSGGRLGLVLILLMVAGTAVAIAIITGSIDVSGGPAPTEKPPPEALPPTAETPAASQDVVLITSTPPGADVMHVSEDPEMEPLPLGKTPLQFQLAGDTGPQTLRIVHPDYEAVDVEVTPGRAKVEVELHPK